MIVAVTMRTANETRYHEERDAISRDWIVQLCALGVTPVLVPNGLPDPVAFLLAIRAERLLLTGGDGLATAEAESMSLRDRTEAALFGVALDRGMPVFGVCRGMQLVNHVLGGALTRGLAARMPQERHAASEHPIVLADGTEAVVNSYHDDGVLKDQLAPSLRAAAFSPQGVVEAVALPGRPVAAVQWHPERAGPSSDLDRAYFRAWLEGTCA